MLKTIRKQRCLKISVIMVTMVLPPLLLMTLLWGLLLR